MLAKRVYRIAFVLWGLLGLFAPLLFTAFGREGGSAIIAWFASLPLILPAILFMLIDSLFGTKHFTEGLLWGSRAQPAVSDTCRNRGGLFHPGDDRHCLVVSAAA